MTTATTRMLLSHNFDLSPDRLTPLSREEFATIFIDGLKDCATCYGVENPHWIVAVEFDPAQLPPAQLGDRITQVLAAHRRLETTDLPQILALGGIKTTPATSPPPALQTGEWGVDVVETVEGDRFLNSIGWDAAIATKPAESIFKSSSG